MHTATVLPHSFQLQNDSLGSGGGGVGAQITSSSQDMVKGCAEDLVCLEGRIAVK